MTKTMTPPGRPGISGDLDRCDSCGAEGRVQVQHSRGKGLVFCAHHYRCNELALIGWTIVRDTRPQLTAVEDAR